MNFRVTWCTSCDAGFNEPVRINRMHRRRDFEFVSVSLNEPEEENRALVFLKQ